LVLQQQDWVAANCLGGELAHLALRQRCPRARKNHQIIGHRPSALGIVKNVLVIFPEA
jgi:hypothetical protein